MKLLPSKHMYHFSPPRVYLLDIAIYHGIGNSRFHASLPSVNMPFNNDRINENFVSAESYKLLKEFSTIWNERNLQRLEVYALSQEASARIQFLTYFPDRASARITNARWEIMHVFVETFKTYNARNYEYWFSFLNLLRTTLCDISLDTGNNCVISFHTLV